MSILMKLDSEMPYLSKSEKTLATFILNNPNKVITMSIQMLAESTNVSTATIVRLCRKLNLSGFQSFKIELSKYISIDNHSLNPELRQNESIAGIKNKTISRINFATNEASSSLNNESIEQLCDLIEEANRIIVYGIGASHVVAMDMYQKFSRLGIHIQCIEDTHLIASILSSLEDKDCFISLSNSGENGEHIKLINLAREHGVKTVGITNHRSNPIAELTDIQLIHGRNDERELRMAATTSLVSQLYTIDIIYYRYIAKNYNKALNQLTLSKSTVDSYKK
ncbi:MurR/RpiR family transcriptional regulator [Staphylococcus massiliensis]|uniref:Transcriptional regulator n=3 Tax=Staphylococcus massiliensis TaxID=555791 RepID=K9B2H9_9STAP|nr:transcriptional regulator [Staphylococcus massiliensis S46]MCG3399433.1 MurR/RpiR family transcriptional regulator [Staphylococcus massiliensis]MCG3411569.1 MurR/RpiR family transcriptional regulator [Staphylococcus massiliensis]PNZ99467.1 MurR/RpiR family transcriptional regulator [Staphylococcus massiliensis CCUG 55927]